MLASPAGGARADVANPPWAVADGSFPTLRPHRRVHGQSSRGHRRGRRGKRLEAPWTRGYAGSRNQRQMHARCPPALGLALSLTTALALSLTGALAAGEAAPAPAPSPAPGDTRSERMDFAEWRHARLRSLSYRNDRIATAIFEILEDLDLYDIDVAEGRLSVSVGRRVYDNHDVLGSFTVADRFRIRGRYPLLSLSEPITPHLSATFSIGTSNSLEFLHIRQVLPNQYGQLESVEQRVSALEALGWTSAPTARATPPPDPDAGPPVVADGPPPEEWMLVGGQESAGGGTLLAFDGLTKARYSKLWNLLVVPGRIPFDADWIGRLRPGEIVSYLGRGTVEVGPSLVLNLDITGLSRTFSADVGVRLFVNGDFRISVLREDADHAQVKLSRTASFGRRATAGGATEDMIEGFQVFGSTIGSNKSSIIPFRFDASRSRGRTFDTVYRYDLRDPQARRAYERAVFGRMAMSDRLAGGAAWRAVPLDAPVRRIGDRDTAFDSSARSANTRLGSAYRHGNDTSSTHSDITVHLRDGRHRVYRSATHNSHRWRWLWGTQERFEHDFRINIDLDRLDRGLPEHMTLTVAGEISDTDTSGPEIHRYIDEVEAAANRPGVFPRPPRYLPPLPRPRFPRDADFERRLRPGAGGARLQAVDYGRSSFFYQVTYSQAQLDRFLATPHKAMWPALEAAFRMPPGQWGNARRRLIYHIVHAPQTLLNLPLFALNIQFRKGSVLIEAERARLLWLAAQREHDARRRARLVGEMFMTRQYSEELARLLRAALRDEQVSYVVQGSSYAFGKVREEGVATTAIDPVPESLQRPLDFDRKGARGEVDPSAVVQELSVSALDHERLRINFRLGDIAPRALYVRLIERRPWRLPRGLGEVVVSGLGDTVHAGANSLVIDRRGGLLSGLLAQTEPGRRYSLVIAVTRDGRLWGPIEDADVDIPAAPERELDPLRPLLAPE